MINQPRISASKTTGYRYQYGKPSFIACPLYSGIFCLSDVVDWFAHVVTVNHSFFPRQELLRFGAS